MEKKKQKTHKLFENEKRRPDDREKNRTDCLYAGTRSRIPPRRANLSLRMN